MKNNKKNLILNTIGASCLSFTSLIFLIIVTRINGIDDAGVFSFAFSLACVMQVIANFGGRSYQVTENNNKILDSDFVYSRIVNCLLMIIATIVFILFNDYTNEKIIIIFLLVLFRGIESFQEVFYGIIQRNEELFKVGISMLAKALISVFIFLAVDIITNNLIIATLTLAFSYLFVFFTYDLFNIKKLDFKFSRISILNIKKIMTGSFSVFIFTLLTQYVMNASKFAIDGYLPDQAQAIFGILIMPATLMVLCSQFLIQPFLTTFSFLIKNNKPKELNKLVIKINAWLLAIGIFVLIISYFIGIPILNFIYGIDLDEYLGLLLIVISGSILFAISYVLCNVLIAMRKNTIQAIIYAIASIFTLIISFIMVRVFNLDGSVYAYALTMLVLLLMYIAYYAYCIKGWKTNAKN